MIKQELEQRFAFSPRQFVEFGRKLSIDKKRRPATSMITYHDGMNGLGMAVPVIGFLTKAAQKE